LLGRQRGGVAGDRLGDERGQPHFFEQVEIVVGCGTIGSQSDCNPLVQHGRYGRETGSQFEIAGWIVGDTHPGFAETTDLASIDVNAVRRNDLGLEESALFGPGDDGHPVGLAPLLDLVSGLGQVNVQRHIVFEGEIHRGTNDIGCTGVRSMRRHRGYDQRVTSPVADELLRRGE
jgi:hypothetical protein